MVLSTELVLLSPLMLLLLLLLLLLIMMMMMMMMMMIALYTVSKNCAFCFFQNFVKFPSILIIFGT